MLDFVHLQADCYCNGLSALCALVVKQKIVLRVENINWNKAIADNTLCPPVLPPSDSLWVYILLAMRHVAHYGQTWRYPQNRKYVTYCVVVRGLQLTYTEHFVKFDVWLLRFARNRHAHRNTLHLCRSRSKCVYTRAHKSFYCTTCCCVVVLFRKFCLWWPTLRIPSLTSFWRECSRRLSSRTSSGKPRPTPAPRVNHKPRPRRHRVSVIGTTQHNPADPNSN